QVRPSESQVALEGVAVGSRQAGIVVHGPGELVHGRFRFGHASAASEVLEQGLARQGVDLLGQVADGQGRRLPADAAPVGRLPARASRMMAAATAGTRPSLWAGGSAVRAGAASASEDGRRASSEVVEVGAPVLGGAGGALDGGTSAGVVDGVFFETDAGARTP